MQINFFCLFKKIPLIYLLIFYWLNKAKMTVLHSFCLNKKTFVLRKLFFGFSVFSLTNKLATCADYYFFRQHHNYAG